MPKIEIYTKGYCLYWRLAKSTLQHNGVSFLEHYVSENPGLFDKMVVRAKGRRTVPQIFIDGVGIGGADELTMMQDKGQLGGYVGTETK